MWPWGHLAFGYLLYSVRTRVAAHRAPTGSETLALALGTQLPDLVDKPLAWTFGVLPSGRSFAHSVFTAVVVFALVYVALRGRGRSEDASAFVVGYVSHLVGDSASHAFRGDFEMLGFLGWPLTATDYGVERGFVYRAGRLDGADLLGPELVLVVLAALLWLRDGAPGLRTVSAFAGRTWARLAET
jgi:hypothetical protein